MNFTMNLPFLASPFQRAVPIWPQGETTAMNFPVLFRTAFEAKPGTLYQLTVTGCTFYRIKFNGSFFSYGPARAGKGVFRIDELPLPVKPGCNCLEIEALGCNVNSYYFMDQPSFLQAEILANNLSVAWTGKHFKAFDLSGEKIRKVTRYSFQRMFSEAYRVRPQRAALPELPLEETPQVKYLPRRVPQPEYRIDQSYRPVATLGRRYDPNRPVPESRYVDNAGSKAFKGFPVDDLELNVYAESLRYVLTDSGEITSTLFEGAINNTGFLHVSVQCRKPGRLIVFFDEVLGDAGGIEPMRLDTANAVFWDLQEPGAYELETIEPYTLKYAEAFMASGEAEVQSLSLREYKSPLFDHSQLATDDAQLNRIFQAGCETMAANAVDCFTDCPSRERGAWCCDSFFMARTAFVLTQDTLLERFFLENIAYAPGFDDLPQGALPMLYPGDHPDGVFIPNWGMWLIIQLEEYFQRSGDRSLVDAFQDKLFAFIHYMNTFMNEDGLLEKLPSWVFIEWSQCKYFVQDVNYPSNMTYLQALEAMSRLYHDPEFSACAQRMKETILAQSWNGTWFCDHAVRQADGSLKVIEGDVTETCQYYAFFSGCATPETFPELWKKLVEKFGPKRTEIGLYPEIWPSNAFIGNYLRLELLSRNGLHAQLLQESKGYFLKMAEQTGTLWEHDRTCGSCCHGFAAYVNVLLSRALQAMEKHP